MHTCHSSYVEVRGSDDFVESALSFQLNMDPEIKGTGSPISLPGSQVCSFLRPRDCDTSCLSPLVRLSSVGIQAIPG